MKSRFSDHIMPRRCVRQFLWLIIESLVLLVLYNFTSMLWRSILYMLAGSPLQILWMLVILLAMAAFPAAWEAIRLSRDATIYGDFMASTADGSYDKKADAKMLWKCDELYNDTAVYAIVYLVCLLAAFAWNFFAVMSDEYYTYEESMAIFTNLLIINSIGYLLLVPAYLFWHHCFSVLVHTKWNTDRMHKAEYAGAEKKPYM